MEALLCPAAACTDPGSSLAQQSLNMLPGQHLEAFAVPSCCAFRPMMSGSWLAILTHRNGKLRPAGAEIQELPQGSAAAVSCMQKLRTADEASAQQKCTHWYWSRTDRKQLSRHYCSPIADSSPCRSIQKVCGKEEGCQVLLAIVDAVRVEACPEKYS